MWRRLFPQRASDADLDDEFAAHLEIETKQLMERGMTREKAEAEAIQERIVGFRRPGVTAETAAPMPQRMRNRMKRLFVSNIFFTSRHRRG